MPIITIIPPLEPVMFYSTSQLALSDEVKEWFRSDKRPKPHGSMRVKGHWGDVYHLGRLADEAHPGWDEAVRHWLRQRGNMREALIVVWTSEG